MAFLKENVSLFVTEHADQLPADVVSRAQAYVKPLPAGKMLSACEAEQIFEDSTIAQWFLHEIQGSRSHLALLSTVITSEG